MNTFVEVAISASAAFSIAGSAGAACFDAADVLFKQRGQIQLDANTTVRLGEDTLFGPPGTNPPNNFFGSVKPDEEIRCHGTGPSIWLSNANLRIEVQQNEPAAKLIRVNYCDMGGYENVGASLRSPPEWIGEIDAVPPQLHDANGQPVDTLALEQPKPGGQQGELVFRAFADYLRGATVGGQEFFIASICVE